MYINSSTEVQVQGAVAVIRRPDHSPTIRWSDSTIVRRFVDPTIRYFDKNHSFQSFALLR